MNLFDLTSIPCFVFEHEPLNSVESIEAIITATFEKQTLEAHLWEQSDGPSPRNIDLTDAAGTGGSLDINVPVFGQHCTEYVGLHFGLLTNCDAEEPSHCQGQNCVGAQSTI